jgi:hypothetical protein
VTFDERMSNVIADSPAIVMPRMAKYEQGVLVVVNWFRRYWVPWAELASVESTDVAVRPNVDIRIVPAAIGAHVGMDRPFTQLTFDKYEPVVCVECETSTAFIEDETAIEAYGEVVRALDESSVDAEESKALIAGLGKAQSPIDEAV